MERGGGAVFGEWGWIAIVVPHGHSRLRASFLEMKSATVPPARVGVWLQTLEYPSGISGSLRSSERSLRSE